MVEILGVKYISEKEAAHRYNYSTSWFQRARYEKRSPPYVKLRGKGKIYYPLEIIDRWFQEHMQLNE